MPKKARSKNAVRQTLWRKTEQGRDYRRRLARRRRARDRLVRQSLAAHRAIRCVECQFSSTNWLSFHVNASSDGLLCTACHLQSRADAIRSARGA